MKSGAINVGGPVLSFSSTITAPSSQLDESHSRSVSKVSSHQKSGKRQPEPSASSEEEEESQQ